MIHLHDYHYIGIVMAPDSEVFVFSPTDMDTLSKHIIQIGEKGFSASGKVHPKFKEGFTTFGKGITAIRNIIPCHRYILSWYKSDGWEK